jgi:PhnB protein
MSNTGTKVPHKPAGYSTVSPYLVVDGAGQTIDFLKRVFKAAEIRRFPNPDGTLMHAEVRIDDTVVMLAGGVEGWPPVEGHVHVYVEDVDDVYARAMAAGATSVREPTQRENEDKRGAVRGPGGTTWWIATQAG